MRPGIDVVDVVFSLVVLAIAVTVAAFSLVVVRFYARALRIAPRDRGLLLWHIVCVASGASGTWLMIGLGQLDYLGLLETARWVRHIGYTAFGLLTAAAIVIIALEQRRRVTKQAPETVVSRREVTVFDSDEHTAGGVSGG